MKTITRETRDKVAQMIDWKYGIAAIAHALDLNDYYVRKIIKEDKLPKPVDMRGHAVVPRQKPREHSFAHPHIIWTPVLMETIAGMRRRNKSWKSIKRTVAYPGPYRQLMHRYHARLAWENRGKPRPEQPAKKPTPKTEPRKPRGLWTRFKAWLNSEWHPHGPP